MTTARHTPSDHKNRIGFVCRLGNHSTQPGTQQSPMRTLRSPVVAALMASGIAITCVLISPAVASAETNTVKLGVAARVASFFRLKIDHQADSMIITESDIHRGYVDFPAATQFSVTSNLATGFVVDFQPQSDLFVSAQVTGLLAPTEFGASGGSAHQNDPHGRISSHRLDYRFHLRPDVTPGIYSWPMKISVRSV